MNYQNKNLKKHYFNSECYFIQDYLCSYLNNKLSISEKKEMEQHLKKCPSCSFEYESLVEFKKEIQNCIANKDIKGLFKKNNKKRKFLFENFITIIFVIVATTSITCLLIDLFNITK